MKAFVIRAVRSDDYAFQGGIATGIHVNIPEGLSFEAAKEYALKHITEELDRYFLHECLLNVGVKE